MTNRDLLKSPLTALAAFAELSPARRTVPPRKVRLGQELKLR